MLLSVARVNETQLNAHGRGKMAVLSGDYRGSRLIEVEGMLSPADAETLLVEADAALGIQGALVLVSLEKLALLDSHTLRTLMKAHRRASAAGGRLALVRVPEEAQEILELTGLRPVFALFDAPDAALGALAG
jgi:anti-anti-sigma factor